MKPPSKLNTRLTAMLWRERAKKIAIVAAIVAGVGGLMVGTINYRAGRSDPTVTVAQAHGTVLGLGRGNASRAVFIVSLRLDDGRAVDAFSQLRVQPLTGARVIVSEATHQSGRISYDVVRIAE